MTKTDILIIGSSAGGLVSALTAKNINPDKKVTVITKNEKTLVPCGIPYIFGSLGSTDKDVMPIDKKFADAGIELIIDEVISINKEEKYCKTKNASSIGYDKLIIATGSLPIMPKWLKGTNTENVFTIPKNKIYLDKMLKNLNSIKKIVVVGAGFIGVEMADELVKKGFEVTLLEKMSTILSLAFDKDISLPVEKILKDRGVKLMVNTSAKEILSENGKVCAVLLDNGQKVNTQAVILSVGYLPNTSLAQKTGISISNKNFIVVDEYMRTESQDIFAVGDCAEKRDFITGKKSGVMLASIACSEGRIAGLNIFELSTIKSFSGTISIFSSALGTKGFGVAGITESGAKRENLSYTTGSFEGIDKHPGTLENTHSQYVKLIVSKKSGIVLGGAVLGGLSSGELTNAIGFIIQNRMNINSVLTSQIGTHPLLTDSPAGYPLIKAAANAIAKLNV